MGTIKVEGIQSGAAQSAADVASAAAHEGAEIDSAAEELLDELKFAFMQRAHTYTLLSRLYIKEVDEALLDELHGGVYPVESGNESLNEGYLLFATYLSNLWSESVSELKVDYARCFLGHGVDGYSAAYPYESVYTSEKRLMMQQARADVLALYASQGIARADNWKEGEDHLALELDFERVLNDRTVEALEAGNTNKAFELVSLQRDFLNNHLRNWVPMLLKDMKVFAQTKFYLGLAFMTEGFLEVDTAFLAEAVDALQEVSAGEGGSDDGSN
jgi:TorA maturation chaperone TorD